MLSENDRKLLTALVDGELNARQSRAVQRLLEQSEEARDLLRHLQHDAQLIRQIPQISLPANSHHLVLHAIQRLDKPQPIRRLQPQPVSLWTGFAAAAAVVLLIGGSTFYLCFQLFTDPAQSPSIARKDEKRPKSEKTPPFLSPDRVSQPQVADSGTKPDSRDSKNESIARQPDRVQAASVKPGVLPEDPENGVRVAPPMETIRPDQVEVFVPELFLLRDLLLPSEKERLRKTLARDDAYYTEILCQEGSVALPRLQAAIRAVGGDVIVGAAAQARIKTPKLRTNYLVYLENVTPADWARILERLAGAEDPRRPQAGQFNSSDPNLILCRMTPEHRKLMLNQLGLDPRQLPVKTSGLRGVDLTRPLSEQTADRVTSALSVASPREPARAEAPRWGVVLPYLPGPARGMTPEVKHFLESRVQPRPGTLQLLLILRDRP